MTIASSERAQIDALLDFWFGAPGTPDRDRMRPIWFRVDPAFDAACGRQFGADQEAAAAGHLVHWLADRDGALALILLLDQMPRNLYRNTPFAYACDGAARIAADVMIARGDDRRLPSARRLFVYLPLEHSETLADQQRCVALMETLDPAELGADDVALTIASARRHLEIIERFGRFPHRNAVLGRLSTPEEEAFLKEKNSSF